jgi:hypothetical protein
MGDPDELALVVKAIKSGLGGCVEWLPQELERVRRDMDHHDLTPEGIRRDVIQFVRKGGKVRQIKETRENRAHRDYYYKIILPMPDVFKKGLFIEMELVKNDPELPEVVLVNAHEQI